jgi:hypothetical protein
VIRRALLQILCLTACLAGSAEVQAQDHSPWSIGVDLGRTTLTNEFVPPTRVCFKPCLLPDIERGTTLTFSIGRRLIGPTLIEASIAPFLERSTQLFHCGGSVAGVCAGNPPVRRWIEYRLALEAHGSGSVHPFLGAAVGDAGYPGFDRDHREHRLIWDVRAGLEAGGRIKGRIEVSRTQHLNPQWDPAVPDEGFADWQFKAGVRLGPR